MIKILVYCWKSICEPMLIEAMEEMEITVIRLDEKIKDYHADAVFSQKCMEVLNREKVQAIFSYDYFPILSLIAQVTKISYISWIYDCPLYTLQSKTLSSEYNHIFCFDKIYAKRLIEDGGKHVYPLVMGTDLNMLAKAKKMEADDIKNMLRATISNTAGNTAQNVNEFSDNISFVGSLYNGEDSQLGEVELTEYTKGYLEGIMKAQIKVYGGNFIKSVLTEEAVRQIIRAKDLSLGELYHYEPAQLAADAVNRAITGRERIEAAERISRSYELKLYTNSKLPDVLKNRNTVKSKGYVDYNRQMPLVFNRSRVNLNITSKTIESGIPQRVLDILVCGGFCLTNYQPEIAEYLIDGEDVVMYESMEDMMDKIKYYLSHEEERQEIAQNGCKKAERLFDIKGKIKEMLDIAI